MSETESTFTQRVLHGVVTELVEAREALDRVYVQVEMLAKEHGIDMPEPALGD
jgi:hypothetical protein